MNSQPKYIAIEAMVRYWEDATINGREDIDGSLIPHKTGKTWHPIIEIETGQVLEWPTGVMADIHYKVCDAGSYFLQDKDFKSISAIQDDYVPSCLSVGDNGYGDYIIMTIDESGKIKNWPRNPDLSDWKTNKETP